jgi:hypothetical protein
MSMTVVKILLRLNSSNDVWLVDLRVDFDTVRWKAPKRGGTEVG